LFVARRVRSNLTIEARFVVGDRRAQLSHATHGVSRAINA